MEYRYDEGKQVPALYPAAFCRTLQQAFNSKRREDLRVYLARPADAGVFGCCTENGKINIGCFAGENLNGLDRDQIIALFRKHLESSPL